MSAAEERLWAGAPVGRSLASERRPKSQQWQPWAASNPMHEQRNEEVDSGKPARDEGECESVSASSGPLNSRFMHDEGRS